MRLSLAEIEDWREFENLIADYFRYIQKEEYNQVKEVFVEPSGDGSDGGRDISITFRVDDSVMIFERKWVVQCKYYSKPLSKANLASVNIPSLIHEYQANGYLLVCRSGVTSKVSEMFEHLRRNCRFNYSYLVWDEALILNKIKSDFNLLERYFPKYVEYGNKRDLSI